MGSGSYSFSASTVRTQSRESLSRDQIFEQRTITTEMSPIEAIRECRDSEEHPNTIPIIIALDVTGSMGHVPEQFIRTGMSKMMTELYDAGLEDAQVLFVAVGDHECDSYPLQVGQFESDDQLLDNWLKQVYLEGGGGGNAGESYLLAWHFAAKQTLIDSYEQRGKKGYLFTIGDEPNLRTLGKHAQERIFGKGQYVEESDASLLEAAQEKYEVYHIHISETYRGRHFDKRWSENLGSHALKVQSHTDIPVLISSTIKSGEPTGMPSAPLPKEEGVDTTEEML